MVIIRSDQEGEAPSEAEREFDALARWWADLRAKGKVIASAVLAPPQTGRTVVWRGQVPLVTDGPYLEAKESVGGFVILEVDSAAEALEIAGAMALRAGIRIELRPIVETP